MYSLFSSDFRKDLNIEKERQTIREPVLSKKRKKIPPISTEISSGNSSNEKRLKKFQPPSSNPISSTTTNSEFKKFFVKRGCNTIAIFFPIFRAKFIDSKTSFNSFIEKRTTKSYQTLSSM